MGNTYTQKFQRKGKMSYSVSLAYIDTKINFEGVQFQQSPYNIPQEKFKSIPMMDITVRNSEFHLLDCPLLCKQSFDIIRTYLMIGNTKFYPASSKSEYRKNMPSTHHIRKSAPQFQSNWIQICSKLGWIFVLMMHLPDATYARVNTMWKIIKYNEGGLFLEHCDRQKQLEGHLNLGTQIFIPPKEYVPHQGGQLVLKDEQKIEQIVADHERWTHVIVPLGVAHQVKKVTERFRISYVKEIWIEDEYDIETDQDRIDRQNNKPHGDPQVYQRRLWRKLREQDQERWKNRHKRPITD